jgi:hypothetical protein
MKTTNEKFEKAIQVKCNSKFSLNDRDLFLPSYEGLSLISLAQSLFGYKRPKETGTGQLIQSDHLNLTHHGNINILTLSSKY